MTNLLHKVLPIVHYHQKQYHCVWECYVDVHSDSNEQHIGRGQRDTSHNLDHSSVYTFCLSIFYLPSLALYYFPISLESTEVSVCSVHLWRQTCGARDGQMLMHFLSPCSRHNNQTHSLDKTHTVFSNVVCMLAELNFNNNNNSY